MPTFEEFIEPFKPYMKRYGFMYVHFKNDTALFAKDFAELIKEFWKGDVQEYNSKVDEWCKENIPEAK